MFSGNLTFVMLTVHFVHTAQESYMYRAEYEQTNGILETQIYIPCALSMLYIPTRNTLYLIPAKYTCSSGWTREYFSYLMSEYYGHHQSQLAHLF